jgi:hypothetical protein
MRGIFAALQLFAAFFLTLLGTGLVFGRYDGGVFLGSLLAATGLTFLALLAVNLRKA